MITSHVLDTSIGKPAAGISVELFFQNGEHWNAIAKSQTNSDGRINEWLNEQPNAGIYKIRFDTKKYFEKKSVASFYPYVEIVFEVKVDEHYHIPLLLSPFGYSTYRGS
jgi:5-hydroxyisourate hydrolase